MRLALAVIRPLEEKRIEAQIIGALANTAYGQGNFDAASRLHYEAIAIHEATGDQRGLAASLQNLGTVSIVSQSSR